MNIIVLGAGLVGLPMAIDLNKDAEFEVTICDIDATRLDNINKELGLTTIAADLRHKETVSKIISDFDLVVNAVPGFMGYSTVKTIIEAGKNVVDIAFFPEDMLTLDALAKEKGVIAISDIGVAPGMSNILSSYAYHQLDKTTDIKILVGGLPKVREWPWEYKAVFSPIDVIEEYTRPARFVRDGKLVVMPALTDPEYINFNIPGTLEAFNSDGLRSLIQTLDCPNMIEKTLRYPGHIEKIRVLRESGFFGTEAVDFMGKQIRPIDLTTKLLFPQWELKPGEADLTVMRIVVKGEKGSDKLRYTYNLYDEYDADTNIHSMARTTGYTATSVVKLIADGLYRHIGMSPPEYIGKDTTCVKAILDYLSHRNIIYTEEIESI